MPVNGPRYSRDQLLSLYTPAEPSHTVLQRLCVLGLRTICSLSVSRRYGSFCLRRYRGHRAGRQRRVAPTLRPTGNGAFVVSASRSKHHSISCSRPRHWLTSVGRSQQIRPSAVFPSASSTSVLWRTRSMIYSKSDENAVSTSCVSSKRGMMQILSVSVAYVPMDTGSSIVYVHGCRRSHRRCRPTTAAWRLYPFQESVCR